MSFDIEMAVSTTTFCRHLHIGNERVFKQIFLPWKFEVLSECERPKNKIDGKRGRNCSVGKI